MNFVSNCRKDRKPPPFCFILSSFLNLFVPFCFALTGGLWTFSNIPPLRHVTMLTFDLYSFSLYLYKPKVFYGVFCFTTPFHTNLPLVTSFPRIIYMLFFACTCTTSVLFFSTFFFTFCCKVSMSNVLSLLGGHGGEKKIMKFDMTKKKL